MEQDQVMTSAAGTIENFRHLVILKKFAKEKIAIRTLSFHPVVPLREASIWIIFHFVSLLPNVANHWQI
jgi:hypothetical protein